MDDDQALPDGVDPEVWFECVHHPGHRDYLVGEPWQTFPGRMQAWCEARRTWFRVSRNGMPEDLPLPTRYWVQGCLVGNVPHQPDADEHSAAMSDWRESARRFVATGEWP